ncbi:helix-turn-helix domain-containing protein [Leucobacter viscericola]|uniref:Helix-turn-helix domain-containing protein n=1 Tax=Leucobacter viscericola TaxID=2714935 RepID=A0A6G7XCW8_9MICO|nr:helix-turn-helix domain-containing protein [Leucobacter viscericola]QIK62316.1 helix-turn-helix domain-containing protein [Leucobacter viscericola]
MMALEPVSLEAASADDFASMPPIMSTTMLADHLPDVSPRTLEDWRFKGIGPIFVRDEDTRRVYYLKSDVVAWIISNRQIQENNEYQKESQQ